MKRVWGFACVVLAAVAFPRPGLCGGAWVPAPGTGDVQLGFSQKTANTSWDASGNSFHNLTTFEGERVGHHHDFRYSYLSGELGLFRRLSATFLVTYLYGLEGPLADLEKNTGMSDAWFGLKYSLRQESVPMALAFTYRTPYFYDLGGPYSRYLYNNQGEIRDVSPEWRGLLKHDYTLSYLVSTSFREGRGWANFQAGYTWREGAPADETPVLAEVGYPLPFWNSAVKVSAVYVRSRGNDSPREPDDRFGSSATFNFNDASMARAGVGFILPLGRTGTTVEVGYNQWLWGRSARQYDEPYLSLGYRF
ncbi:MAG TPA: hypothetical protein VF756_10410 [Thermoanaerobaculia bacterium]